MSLNKLYKSNDYYTAFSDYKPHSASLKFDRSTSEPQCTCIDILEDTVVEDPELFQVVLTVASLNGSNDTLVSEERNVTIVDSDDGEVSVSVLIKDSQFILKHCVSV